MKTLAVSADGYPDSLIKINEILDFDRFSDGPWREIIETGEAGFAQTIRPRSALASDRKSIKITMKFSGCAYSVPAIIVCIDKHV